ncbi:uncharacterized protein LOC117293747 [Asterias rubens]|uniref:uncharacterized protein LOC117293747 n=1 Tax=Asterias rubens TaxID=7604 RepID=UPI001455C08B|nr:uncharacterized protein LOC117293747 [Asterias rubens]
MNSQRSETGLNWCSADWGGCTRYFDCGCDGTNSSTSAVITPGTCTNHRRSETESHRCCTHRCTPAVTAGTIQATCTSCVNRASPNAGTGMAGRLTAGTSTPYWRQANGTNHRNYPDMGVLTLLQSCLAITSTWMSYSSRALTGGWMVYLFFYLIILNTGLSTSHSLDASRQPTQRSEDATLPVNTVEDYLQKNFPNRSGSDGESSVNNRVRLGRAGKLKPPTMLNMKRIEQENARASCQPRDTVLDSYKELNIPKGFDTKVFPACIVVQRCRSGGCCRDDQECVPRSNGRQNVSKLFLVNTLVTTRSIVEDVHCECVAKPDFCSPPETDCPNGKVWSYGQCGCTCHYRCPKPFLQDENTCACDCLMNNRVCKNIQRGRKDLKLSVEECDCVRRGLCATPNCVNGRFSLNKCKCVQEQQSR